MADLARVARELTLAAQGSHTGVLDRLCAACARTLPVDGAAIALMAPGGRPMARSASDEYVAGLEELQYTLGEGPGLAAFTQRQPVAVADLSQPDSRWPVFASQAAALAQATGNRFRAVFSFPLALGQVPLGVLALYRGRPSELDAELRKQAQLAVDTVALTLVGTAASQDGDDPGWLYEALEDHVEVDQAVGMTMVQLDLGEEEALAWLRGHAFAEGLMIGEVARAVVTRRLRFSREEQ